MMKRNPEMAHGIKALVFQALDNARENGYSFPEMTFAQIAEDIVECDAELENTAVDIVEPYVRDYWLERKV
jgi:hypothetical protein